MGPTRRRDRAEVLCKLILAALQRQDARLNELAHDALVAIGTGAVHTLVIEAFTSKNIGYRLRLLRAIEAIGEVPDPMDHAKLFILLGHGKSAKIREAVKRVILAVAPHSERRQAKVPESAETSPASVTRPLRAV
jgi:hypothetical protein